MKVELPPIIKKYIEASNQHDVKAILACFSADAVVRDEGEMLRGKEAIEGWLVRTIEKYKFQLKPLSVKEEKPEVIMAIEVSGSFPGSPVIPDYHFKLEQQEILALAIE